MNVSIDSGKLNKIVDFVEAAQVKLEKVATMESAVKVKAQEVVDALVKAGMLSPHLKEAKTQSLSSNPVEILETLKKAASLIPAPTLGGGADKSVGTEPTADQVFERRLMGR